MDDPPALPARKPCCVCDAPRCQHCTKCKSRHYCGKACQLVEWSERGHKAQCRQMASEYQGRLLDSLMSAKKVKEEPVIVADVAPADGSKAVARLTAVRTTALVKVSAPNGDTPDWCGTCAICLDVLPLEGESRRFYDCCCKCTCTDCSVKCVEYDMRCPLCRLPAYKSHAERVRRVQKHADEGNAEAQVELGYAYPDATNGLKNKRARQSFERTAAQGYVGLLLLCGAGRGD